MERGGVTMFVFVGYDLEFSSVANTAQLQRHNFGERSAHIRVCQLCEKINKYIETERLYVLRMYCAPFQWCFVSTFRK